MSTRSTITIETPEGFRSIYCHFDGNLEHVGAILKDHYNTADKVNELIDLGALSSLSTDLENTIAYHRDRKEPLSITIDYNSIQDIYCQTYNYLFREGKWFFWRGDLNQQTPNEL